MTVTYKPQVAGKLLETRKGQEVRSKILQRVQHLTFRTCIQASHRGAWMDVPDSGRVRVSLRALLYVCDQKEERAVMCLKASGCLCPCTPCMARRETSCFEAGASAPACDVQATVAAQLSNATIRRRWGSQARRAEVELAHSLNSVVPAMASWAGLGNGPRMLYRLPGFDRWHPRCCRHFTYALPHAPRMFFLRYFAHFLTWRGTILASLRCTGLCLSGDRSLRLFGAPGLSATAWLSQVLDIGVNRKVASSPPVYLRRVAGAGGQARLDTVTKTERAINLRFKFASRRLRVPHIYPG